ncbi:hypothetical protein LJY25_10300 [Hymenobacter sp. BT175]|uniref:hypothetical protein n=1 Tax=Hymenobacter translucens TaxID=2886507 RepID=UPI001D0ECB75|nr:hypothetical protein [Hymenobacter translucens]MCC2546835.1 hypothetical protein [Hymenobacter translucens]
MKKLVLLVMLAVSFQTLQAVPSFAGDLRAQATEATRKLASQISLDDARTAQVRRFTYERLVQEQEIATMYSDDPKMQQDKLRVVQEEYTEKLKTVLTEVQFQRYMTIAGVAPASTPGAQAARP